MKEFATTAVLSLVTSKSFCGFGDVHEAAEYVLGHSVWTHEFAEKSVWEKLRAAVLLQHPQLANFDASGMNRENAQQFIERAEATFGKTLALCQGSEARTESPLASLERIAPGKPVVVIPPPQ